MPASSETENGLEVAETCDHERIRRLMVASTPPGEAAWANCVLCKSTLHVATCAGCGAPLGYDDGDYCAACACTGCGGHGEREVCASRRCCGGETCRQSHDVVIVTCADCDGTGVRTREEAA